MKKKLKINELKVQSFVTQVTETSVMGGGSLNTCPRCAPISQWCITENICDTLVASCISGCETQPECYHK